MQERPKLTARQQQILDLIQSAIARTGAPPTRAEIAAELGFKSANAAEEHLQALARKGVIELVSGTSRGIRLQATPCAPSTRSRSKQFSLPLPSLAQLDAAAGRPGRGRQPDPGAGACRPDLPDGSQPVPAPARLPAQGARHEHARRRHHGRRPARGAEDQGRQERPDRGGPAGRRGHRQALPAQQAPDRAACPRTPTSRPSSVEPGRARSRSKAWPSA